MSSGSGSTKAALVLDDLAIDSFLRTADSLGWRDTHLGLSLSKFTAVLWSVQLFKGPITCAAFSDYAHDRFKTLKRSISQLVFNSDVEFLVRCGLVRRLGRDLCTFDTYALHRYVNHVKVGHTTQQPFSETSRVLGRWVDDATPKSSEKRKREEKPSSSKRRKVVKEKKTRPAVSSSSKQQQEEVEEEEIMADQEDTADKTDDEQDELNKAIASDSILEAEPDLDEPPQSPILVQTEVLETTLEKKKKKKQKTPNRTTAVHSDVDDNEQWLQVLTTLEPISPNAEGQEEMEKFRKLL
jgi:hypothetical protein